MSGKTWLYVSSVMLTVEWPSISETILGVYPLHKQQCRRCVTQIMEAYMW